MNHEIFTLGTWLITPWKIIGYIGILLFGGRWVVQMIASRKEKKPVLPRLFWYMSILGSFLILLYFLFGKNDSIGVLSNISPLIIASYNLYLDIKNSHILEQEADS